jgi:error-prone DNA polymerase
MAAWRRTGRIEAHRERLITRMQAKGIAPEFAERVFEQICGFGEYGFPESHAASFALVSYAAAYLRCHYPAEFTCAILNAQPMGFYSPATLVEDAKRHGVEIRPVDVRSSGWDCTLEETAGGWFAVRMGLRYVKGLGEGDWKRIEPAAGSFTSLEDFVRRTRLDEGALTALAEAGAFDGFGLSRREALWEVRGLFRDAATPLPLRSPEPTPEFPRLDAYETIAWDYRRTSHSPRGHPLSELRPALAAQGLPDARTVAGMRHGALVRYAGIVICRQRPGTASGVTFMTLEDETGFVNVVVWSRVFERHALLIRTESFLGVTGRLQARDGVVHVVAEAFWKPPLLARPASGGSHDFH